MMFDEQHKVLQEKKLSRAVFHQFIKNHLPCKVVMEACYSAHYWGRELQQLGYQVQLVPAQHVTPFVRGIRMIVMILWLFLRPVSDLLFVRCRLKLSTNNKF